MPPWPPPPPPPLLAVLWGCLLTVVYAEPTTECRENQYPLRSQCCDLCPPGKKLASDCTEFTQTQCLQCGKGEFSDAWSRETHCHQHRYCDPHLGLEILKTGTAETDTVCTCAEGWHCIGRPCESCALNNLCGPGFGVKQMATETEDTVCEPCPFGFFSNDSSASEACRPWTSCEAEDLVMLQHGTKQSDVVCGKAARKPKAKALPPQDVWQDPVEMEDFSGHNPATPVQETLHGCQPITQEEGKESRISVQERQ
ncbi:tumor necrosis factor receptor superfamily member 5 isoform 2-T2 [Thomomys bottae]